MKALLNRNEGHQFQTRGIARTANAALAASILAGARLPAYTPGADTPHGVITTANASLFAQAHFSEPMTSYATGWRDPYSFDARCEFLAPSIMPSGDYFEYITYENAEAFFSDGQYDDLRAIGADFKTVDFTSDKVWQKIPNRGLRIVLDWDRIKTMANWEQYYTGMLLQRIKRNAFRRKVALAIASATNVPLVWDPAGAADPDNDLVTEVQATGDVSGITPNRALWGIGAQLLRFATYGATNTAKAMTGRLLTPVEASSKIGLEAQVDESRYQSGITKARILGSQVILFNAYGTSTEDPSNFKTAKGPTQQGGETAVYVRQLSVKQWEIVVEVYEMEWCATPLGVTLLSVTAS
jgi:hypothetical protein